MPRAHERIVDALSPLSVSLALQVSSSTVHPLDSPSSSDFCRGSVPPYFTPPHAPPITRNTVCVQGLASYRACNNLSLLLAWKMTDLSELSSMGPSSRCSPAEGVLPIPTPCTPELTSVIAQVLTYGH